MGEVAVYDRPSRLAAQVNGHSWLITFERCNVYICILSGNSAIYYFLSLCPFSDLFPTYGLRLQQVPAPKSIITAMMSSLDGLSSCKTNRLAYNALPFRQSLSSLNHVRKSLIKEYRALTSCTSALNPVFPNQANMCRRSDTRVRMIQASHG